jgi:hypothetical protein
LDGIWENTFGTKPAMGAEGTGIAPNGSLGYPDAPPANDQEHKEHVGLPWEWPTKRSTATTPTLLEQLGIIGHAEAASLVGSRPANDGLAMLTSLDASVSPLLRRPTGPAVPPEWLRVLNDPEEAAKEVPHFSIRLNPAPGEAPTTMTTRTQGDLIREKIRLRQAAWEANAAATPPTAELLPTMTMPAAPSPQPFAAPSDPLLQAIVTDGLHRTAHLPEVVMPPMPAAANGNGTEADAGPQATPETAEADAASPAPLSAAQKAEFVEHVIAEINKGQFGSRLTDALFRAVMKRMDRELLQPPRSGARFDDRLSPPHSTMPYYGWQDGYPDGALTPSGWGDYSNRPRARARTRYSLPTSDEVKVPVSTSMWSELRA